MPLITTNIIEYTEDNLQVVKIRTHPMEAPTLPSDCVGDEASGAGRFILW